MTNMRGLIGCLLCCFILLSLTNDVSMADEVSHSHAAVQLVELTFNKKAYHDNAMKFALLAIKDRYENNPKTKPYSGIIINALMEVMESYINDVETQNKVKEISTQLYMEEFTEIELREIMKFYRSKVGQKALLKTPMIMQKQWDIESQLSLPPKYEQMILNEIKTLQHEGKLPEQF